MKKLLLLILAALLVYTPQGASSVEPEKHEMPPYYEGSGELKKIKGLAGEWTGVQKMGEELIDVRVTYEVTSNGSIVVEKLFPGTPNEMVSVYSDINGKLSMTHYCTLANQPKMDLSYTDANSITLDFAPDNIIDPVTEDHMHSLSIIFNGTDSITHNWTFFKGGQKASSSEITLSRVKYALDPTQKE